MNEDTPVTEDDLKKLADGPTVPDSTDGVDQSSDPHPGSPA